jgi:hypothetical protein
MQAVWSALAALRDRLTDLPLRRLYRYILRRTIGKYLVKQRQLDVDQLRVDVKDGRVSLVNLQVCRRAACCVRQRACRRARRVACRGAIG